MSTLTANSYLYASNDPVNQTDASGLIDVDFGCMVACMTSTGVLRTLGQLSCGSYISPCFAAVSIFNPACYALAVCAAAVGGAVALCVLNC